MADRTKILDSIYSSIKNSDQKASSMLTAVGVIFAFSIFPINNLQQKNEKIRTVIIVFAIIYFMLFILLIGILLCAIYPRRKNRIDDKYLYNMYSEDVYKAVKNNCLEDLINKNASDDVVNDQIIQLSKIAHTKETLLRLSVYLSIIFSFVLVVLCCLTQFD